MAKLIKSKIENLTPDDHNFNKGSEYGNHLIEKSFREFGAGRSILIDRNNRIIAGNKSIEAASSIGMENVVIVETTGDEIVAVKRTDIDLDSKKGRELALADNATNKANLDFDEEEISKLSEQFEFDASDWGIDLGIDVDVEEAELSEDEKRNIEKRCNLGDVWQLGKHRLICGDSTDLEQVERLLGGVKIDLLMTDPPYGINADKMTLGTGNKQFHRGEWDNSRPTITPYLQLAKYSCIWGGNYFTDELPISNDWLCWNKNNSGLSFSEFELAWTNFQRNCRLMSHHWAGEVKLHPTMKPLEVIKWALQQPKEECNTVLDVFGGSGTTMIACEELGKQCYTIELDPIYCDVIIERWEKLTGLKAELVESKTQENGTM